MYEASRPCNSYFNNTKMIKFSTAAVYLDIEIAVDAIWHHGLLCKLSKFEFFTNLIKLNSTVFSQRKSRVSVDGICQEI
jgi:hypothetical protein